MTSPQRSQHAVSSRTKLVKPAEVNRAWYIVDAENKTLGRLATEIANVIRGKHKPSFAPHMDAGDFVVVVNAAKVKLTGNKLESKTYNTHSQYPGGFKQEPYGKLLGRRPEIAIENAVWGMIPKGPLGRQIHKKLKVYAGSDHPHAAQNPVALGHTAFGKRA